jgi:amino acid transporter
VNKRTRTPTNAIWLAAGGAFILGLPYLFNATAYAAVTSIAVIGLYIAYVVPVLLRRLNPEFSPGPWSLGRWSPFIGWVAVVWVVIICVLFVLPPTAPVTVSTFNYAPVAVLIVVIFSVVSWQVSGKKNFMHGAKDEHTTMSKDEVLGEQR